MICNIWVKDGFDGTVHQVGTEDGDALFSSDGEIFYKNLVNGDDSLNGGIYEIIDSPDMSCYVSITPESLKINKELIHQDLKLHGGK